MGQRDERTDARGPTIRNSGLANQGEWEIPRCHLLLGDVGAPRAAPQHVASLVIFAVLSQLSERPPGPAVPPQHLSPSHSGWRAEQGGCVLRNIGLDTMRSHLVEAIQCSNDAFVRLDECPDDLFVLHELHHWLDERVQRDTTATYLNISDNDFTGLFSLC